MTRSEDNAIKPSRGHNSLSLKARLLLPFLLTLLLLAVTAGIGSFQLFKISSSLSVDDRLQAAREILYREFKKQEVILKTYTSFLQQFQSLVHLYPEDTEVGILQDRLFKTLEKADITVSFFPMVSSDFLPIASLQELFDQVRRSGEPRFRYTDQLSALPMLIVAAPLYENGEAIQIMLLQTAMGGNFLHQATAPLDIKASLHNLDGAMLAESDSRISPILLKEEQLTELSSGKQLFLEHPGDSSHRHLLTAIPLGTSDLIFLSLEASTYNNSARLLKLALPMIAGILITLLLGGVYYLKIVSSIIRPLGDIQEAADAINQGQLSHRVINPARGELGRLAGSVNLMADNLSALKNTEINPEANQAIIEQQTRSQLLLQKKEEELAKAREELQIHQRETGALLQLNQAMISSTDLEALFDRVLQVLRDVLGCDHIVLLLYNPRESILEVSHAVGIKPGSLDNVTFSFEQGICGQVAQSKKMIYAKDVEQDSRTLSYHGQIATRGSLVSSPMVIKDRLIGVLNLHKIETEAFTTSELKLIQAAANQAAIAIDNTQLFEKSLEMTNIDALTGLCNRRSFQEALKREVAQARRFNSLFSTILCDIDHFRSFNDTHGRLRGDGLLRQVGQSLLRMTRGIDVVCRFGNEQFVILLPKTDKAGAFATAEKLRLTILQESFTGEAESQPNGKLTMSFGITEFPADSMNIYELINLADRALYFAKKKGHNQTVGWSEELEETKA